jgi:hypothetical protein
VLELLSHLLPVVVATVLGSIVNALLLHYHVLPWDRRYRANRGLFDLPLATGNCAAWVAREAPADWRHLRTAAVQALAGVGARDIAWLDPWSVTGWTSVWRFPVAQQLGVTLRPTPRGFVIWCSSRPLMTTALFGHRACARQAGRLAEELARLLGPPGTPPASTGHASSSS